MTEYLIYLAIKDMLAEYLQGWSTKLNFVDSSVEKSIGVFVKLQNAKYRMLADGSETNRVAHIQLFMIGEASEQGLFEAGSLAETIREQLIKKFNHVYQHVIETEEPDTETEEAEDIEIWAGENENTEETEDTDTTKDEDADTEEASETEEQATTDTYEISWLRCDPMSGSEFIGYNQNQAPQYSINVRLTFNVERRHVA